MNIIINAIQAIPIKYVTKYILFCNKHGRTINVQGRPPKPPPHIKPKIFVDIGVLPKTKENKTVKPIP